MALDLRQPEGKEVLSRLLKENDIFVENAKGGSLAHMGITDEWIWSYNPKMVIVHVSGYGQSGDPSYTGRPCLDAIAQAFSGYMNLNGLPDMPMVARLYTADYMELSPRRCWRPGRPAPGPANWKGRKRERGHV